MTECFRDSSRPVQRHRLQWWFLFFPVFFLFRPRTTVGTYRAPPRPFVGRSWLCRMPSLITTADASVFKELLCPVGNILLGIAHADIPCKVFRHHHQKNAHVVVCQKQNHQKWRKGKSLNRKNMPCMHGGFNDLEGGKE